jgi:hypothetical protein
MNSKLAAFTATSHAPQIRCMGRNRTRTIPRSSKTDRKNPIPNELVVMALPFVANRNLDRLIGLDHLVNPLAAHPSGYAE